MERSLKSASPPPPPPQDPQRSPPPLPQMETQLSPTTGPPPGRSSRVYTIEDILGRPQAQESSAPQVNAVDSQVAGKAMPCSARPQVCSTAVFKGPYSQVTCPPAASETRGRGPHAAVEPGRAA